MLDEHAVTIVAALVGALIGELPQRMHCAAARRPVDRATSIAVPRVPHSYRVV